MVFLSNSLSYDSNNESCFVKSDNDSIFLTLAPSFCFPSDIAVDIVPSLARECSSKDLSREEALVVVRIPIAALYTDHGKGIYQERIDVKKQHR